MPTFRKISSVEEGLALLEAGLLWVNQSSHRVLRERHRACWVPAKADEMWWCSTEIRESFERKWSRKDPGAYRKDDFAALVED